MPGVAVSLPSNTGIFSDKSGNSFAVPHAAAGMATNIDGPFFTGKDKKCAMIVSAPQTTVATGWGWEKPHIQTARTTDGQYSGTVSNGAFSTIGTISVPAGKTFHGGIIWWREMSNPTTESHRSDVDLYVYNSGGGTLDSSTLARDTVERVEWTNTGGSSVSVTLKAYGFNVPGGTGQQYGACWDVR